MKDVTVGMTRSDKDVAAKRASSLKSFLASCQRGNVDPRHRHLYGSVGVRITNVRISIRMPALRYCDANHTRLRNENAGTRPIADFV